MREGLDEVEDALAIEPRADVEEAKCIRIHERARLKKFRICAVRDVPDAPGQMAIFQLREDPAFAVRDISEIGGLDCEIVHGLVIKAVPQAIFPGEVAGTAFLLFETHGARVALFTALHAENVRWKGCGWP